MIKLPIFSALICLAFSLTSGAQQHLIMLDNLKAEFVMHNYTLNTKKLYDVDKTIEMYNVEIMGGTTILLLTVLPSFTSNENWQKVDTSTIAGKILSNHQIVAYAEKIALAKSVDFDDVNTLSFRLIKKTDSGYYMSKACLTEVFNIRHYQPPFITAFKTLNTASQAISIKEFLQKIPFYASVMDCRDDHNFLPDRVMLQREYLSKTFSLGKDIAYQFWTFTDWGVMDYWNVHRGIDRLVYIPGKGIVGGSYDFWFSFVPSRLPVGVNYMKGIPVSGDKLWNNIIKERVMLPEELEKKLYPRQH